jgi:2-oxo-4-hydroxy-4-carboxy-5-ureidoimidazoline decarboxylase
MSRPRQTPLPEINSLDRAAFTALLGGIFEKSPWVADAAWEKRPFASTGAILAAMVETVETAGGSKLLDLIRAHPDLGARLPERAELTPESLGEQSSTGLFDTSPAELDRLRALNAEYTSRFGFPFIICARLNSVATIFDSIQTRLHNTRETEIAEAWRQIQKIAALRLADIATD